jgi:hypothetical protein
MSPINGEMINRKTKNGENPQEMEKENREMEFWRNREWSIRETLHCMAVEILVLGTKKKIFFSVSPNLHFSVHPCFLCLSRILLYLMFLNFFQPMFLVFCT